MQIVKRKRKRELAYQPRSSPPSKNEQSPLTTQSQPPTTPLPLRQLMSGTSSAFCGLHFAGLPATLSSAPSWSTLDVAFRRLTNLEKEQVKQLKSSAPSSS